MSVGLLKPNEIIGDTLPILTWQVKRILKNCNFNQDIKSEWVQWVTKDVSRTSLKSLTQLEARIVISTQEGRAVEEPKPENWAKFDASNPKHRKILSLLIQATWSINDPVKGEIADLERFSRFLKSDKSPVKKPLMIMAPTEVDKVIKSLNGIVKSIWK